MSGFVYIIKSGDYAKVGYSQKPEQRLVQIAKHTPLPTFIARTFEGGKWLEYRLHRYLIEQHVHGEWFRWCADLDRLVSDGVPEWVPGLPPGSPFHPARGGRKPKTPRMVEA